MPGVWVQLSRNGSGVGGRVYRLQPAITSPMGRTEPNRTAPHRTEPHRTERSVCGTATMTSNVSSP